MKYMHEGRVYLLYRRSANACDSTEDTSFSPLIGQRAEYFWLCRFCSEKMRITSTGELIAADPLRSRGLEANSSFEDLIAA